MPQNPTIDLSAGDTPPIDLSAGDTPPLTKGAAPTPQPGGVTRGVRAFGEELKAPFQGAADLLHDLNQAIGRGPEGWKALQAKYPASGSMTQALKGAVSSLNPVNVRRTSEGKVDVPASVGGTAGRLAIMVPLGEELEGSRAVKGAEGAESRELSPRTKALTRASGTSTAVDIPKAWENALPELSKTVNATATPYEGVQGMKQVVQDTMEQTQTRYALGLRRIAGQSVGTHRIGDDIRAMRVSDPANPAEIRRNQYLIAKASEWDKPYTYQQLDRLREDAGNRLKNYYKDKPSNQAAAAKQDANLAIDRVLDRDLGEVIYPAIDHANRLPVGTTQQLKLTQSSLYKLRDQLASRGITMSNEEAKAFLERVRAHSYLSSGGHIGAAIGGLTEAAYPETARVRQSVRKGLAPTKPKGGVKGKVPRLAPLPLPRRDESNQTPPSNSPISLALPAPLAENATDAWQRG